jgi:hypothetical protein
MVRADFESKYKFTGQDGLEYKFVDALSKYLIKHAISGKVPLP